MASGPISRGLISLAFLHNSPGIKFIGNFFIVIGGGLLLGGLLPGGLGWCLGWVAYFFFFFLKHYLIRMKRSSGSTDSILLGPLLSVVHIFLDMLCLMVLAQNRSRYLFLDPIFSVV